MRVVYHPDAEAEVLEAAQYYESKLIGLGSDFLTEIDTVVDAILIDPLRFPVTEDDIHRYLVKRFPYGIYYRIASALSRFDFGVGVQASACLFSLKAVLQPPFLALTKH